MIVVSHSTEFFLVRSLVLRTSAFKFPVIVMVFQLVG